MITKSRFTLITFLILLFSSFSQALETKLVASDGEMKQRFGASVAIDKSLILIGAPGTFADRNYTGAVYVYEQYGNEWLERQKLEMQEAGSYDFFGFSVAISDSYAFVSAKGDSLRNPYGGAVFVFQQQDDNSWIQLQKLVSAQKLPTDMFGACVDIDAHYAVVGAPTANGMAPLSGSVHIYKLMNAEWRLDSTIFPRDGKSADYFGYAVAISGDRLVVGATGADQNPNSLPLKPKGIGAAYIFERDENGWQQVAKLKPQDANVGNMFGCAVAIDGDYIVVGAGKDDVTDFDTGSAYLYQRQESGWVEDIKLTAMDADSGDYFGAAVSIWQNYLVIGAPGVNGLGKNSGAVYSFLRGEEGWAQRSKKMPYDAATRDYFGAAIALSEELSVIGAPHKKVEGKVSQGVSYIYDNIADLALPVELNSFTATLVENGVLLQWQTQSEKDNLGFILERKSLSEDWRIIASFQTHNDLRGQGSSSMPTYYEFTDDTALASGTYDYRLADVDMSGVITYHDPIEISISAGIAAREISLPRQPHFHTAYPNPFNPQTVIRYEIPTLSNVTIRVFNMTGQRVRTLMAAQSQSAGHYSVIWDGQDDNGEPLSSGVFFIQFQIDNIVHTQKVILLP